MNTIYSRKTYNIYRENPHAYIVHNTKKQFKYGHTHVSNYNTAKMIIHLSLNKIIPTHLNKYLIESVIRISVDKTYINQLKEML